MKLIESLRYSAQMHIEQNASSMPVPPDLFLALCGAAEALPYVLGTLVAQFPKDTGDGMEVVKQARNALAKLDALEQKP